MPATSERQKRFFQAELGRKKAGKKTKTGLSLDQIHDFVKTPRGNTDITSPLGLSRKKPR
jgi:hypothetical protein